MEKKLKKTKLVCASALLAASALAVPRNVCAETTYTWLHDGKLQTSESTVLTDLGTSWKNGDVLTIYAANSTANKQFSGGNVGESGTMTVQSGTPGTQVTITTNLKHRFADFAHGTYVLKDLKFIDCGKTNDGGGVFYRNDLTSTTFEMDNVLIEDCVGTGGAALRAATGMTVSGTYTFTNNTHYTAVSGAIFVHAGSLTLEGDDSVGTFTGTKFHNGTSTTVGYDLYASNAITFKGTGTYSLGSGFYSKSASIEGANVTLGSDAGVHLANALTISSGTLNLNTSKLSVASVQNDGTLNVGVSALTLKNLSSSTDSAGVVKTASGISNAVLTLENVSDTVYCGTLEGFSTVKKTGTGTLRIYEGFSADKIIISEGMLNLDDATADLSVLNSDVYLENGGTLRMYANLSAGTQVLGGGKLYVAESGGTLTLCTSRGYLTVSSEEGVQSGNLILNGTRAFIVGDGGFNGYYELTAGNSHFSNEALTSSKGIILNGGTLQVAGEIATQRDLTAPIYLKETSAIQCGWSQTFNLNSPISDMADADLTGKFLRINTDSGLVSFNGTVKTAAILQPNDSVGTNGANDVEFGGLQTGNVAKGFTSSASAATDKSLILNVAASTSPNYQGTLTGTYLNLVKTGAGTQTFTATGIGTEAAPIASVSVNSGTMKMASNAPIHAKKLTVGEEGTLAFGTGTYVLDVDSMQLLGAVDLAFASADSYTTFLVGAEADQLSADLVNGIFTLSPENGYVMEQFETYTIANSFPSLGDDFNYDLLLDDAFRYDWNLTYSNGSLLLSMDSSAVPEPSAWALLLLGAFGIVGAVRRKNSR